MLTILTSRADGGSTEEIFAQMRTQGKNRPQILLVPEQSSFEAEVRLCEENGNQAGLTAQVLSFSRLENRVLALTGGGARQVLDEGGRLLVMYAALKAVAGNLSVYALPSRKPEFLTSLLTTVDELKSYCVTAADLEEVAGESEGIAGEKLRDLSLIFGAYEAMTARGKLDPRDRLTRLAEKLQTSTFAVGKDFYLAGFTDFTPQEGLVLAQLLRRGHAVTVALTCDSEAEQEEEVFLPAKRTIAWLTRLAEQGGCPVRQERVNKKSARPAALRHLEQGLFGNHPTPFAGPWQGEVCLRKLAAPRDEVEWTAGQIRALAQRGMRYRDITVTARSIEPYGEWIESIFAQYDIPVFQAKMTDILQKPIFSLIIAALDTVTGQYAYEDVFRYLKTGLTDLTPEECDRLENYVLTWNIRGSGWTAAKGWTLHPGGYHQKWTETDLETLKQLNDLRCKVISPFICFDKKGKKAIREQVLSLYKFLEEIHLPDTLAVRTDALLDRGEPERAEEYRQLWEIFCSALEQCVELLGENEADLEEFSRLLRLLLSRYSVGSIPASLDRVTVGDAPRIAHRRGKALFFLGADDSSLPLVTPGQGLLTEEDRELLEAYGWKLSPQMEEKVNREYTIVYEACTQPEERIFVCWPGQGVGGGEKRPSFLVERLRILFPQGEGPAEQMPSPDALLAQACRRPALQETLAELPAYRIRMEQLERLARWKRGRLSPRSVERLYGRKVAMSASRMDRYQSCHFAYFMKFGLAAQERKPAGFHAPEYGTFLHYILEHVLRQVQEAGGVREVPKETVQELTRQAVRRYVIEELGGMENQTPRFRYLFRRLLQTVQTVVENVTEELLHSEFQPVRFELGFGSGQELPPVELTQNGVTLRISGFVDRVDGWGKDGRLYLRVVDYKTGRKSFDLTEIWNGLGLQMLLYLFTLEEHGPALFGRETLPAGVLYLPAREAAVAGSRTMEEDDRRRRIDKELVRRGLLLEDPAVLEAMEPLEHGMRFLPVKVSASTGKITGDCLVSAQQLGRLKKHTERILGDICREIAGGNIAADPFWRGPARNACQYCEFFQACQFEEGRDRRRWIPTVKNSDFWSWLEERGEGEQDGL